MNSIIQPTPANSILASLQLRDERVVAAIGIAAFLLALACSVAGRMYLEARLLASNAAQASSAAKERSLAKGDILVPVKLSLKLIDGRAVLRGMLPDAASHQTVVARAREIYGWNQIEDNLGIQRGIVVTPWFDSVLKWFPPRVAEFRAGEISISGMNVLIFGKVGSVEARQAAGKTLAALVGSEGQFSNELEVSDADDTPAPSQAQISKAKANEPNRDAKRAAMRIQF